MTQEQAAELEALIAQWRADAQHDVEDAMEAEGKDLWVTAGGLLARADQRRTDANELESALRALREGTTERTLPGDDASKTPMISARPLKNVSNSQRTYPGYGAVPASPIEASRLQAIDAFIARVNTRAEADMLNGRPVTGAHHRAIEAELAALRAAHAVPSVSSPEKKRTNDQNDEEFHTRVDALGAGVRQPYRIDQSGE